MLSVHEFSAGESNTAKPISLLLPTVTNDREILIAGSDDVPIAIFLEGGDDSYRWFNAAQSYSWSGLIIPNLRVEVDERSAFDARAERSPFGAVIRIRTELSICAKEPAFNDRRYIPLEAGLQSVGDHQVGFRRWQLVLGERTERRIIRAFDLTQTSKS